MKHDDLICCAAQLPDAPSERIEWIHLLPGGVFSGRDGRGPYRVTDATDLIKASLARGQGKLVIDENHATDLAAPQGRPAPAIGWIDELEARSDGIWGHVSWNARGKALLDERAYRGVSPVIQTDRAGHVLTIARASLTNMPNLPLNHLHHSQTQEPRMELDEVRSLLSLDADANEDAVRSALTSAHAAQQSLKKLATLAGVAGDAEESVVLHALRARVSGQETATQQIAALKSQIAALETANKKAAAQQFVERMGREKVIPKEMIEEFISVHMQRPELAEKLVGALPDVPRDVTGFHAARPAVTGESHALFTKMDAALGLQSEKGGQSHGA